MFTSVFSSLRVRLVLLVAVAMLPAFGLIVYSGVQQRDDKKDAAAQDVSRVSETIVARQDQYIEGGRQFLSVLATLVASTTADEIDATACSGFLSDLLERYPRYANIGIADGDGAIFCSGLPSGPVDASERTWFVRAAESGSFAIGDYQIGSITQTATVNLGYPALNASGDLAFVIFAALDLAWLNQAAADADLSEGAALSIVDASGVILARYPDPEQWVGKTADRNDDPAAAASGSLTEARGVDGVERLYATVALGETSGAYVRVGIPTSSIYADANRTLSRNLVLLAVATLLAGAAAWFLGGALVVRKVRVVLDAAGRVSGGELNARTGLEGEGDLDRLGRGFDAMAETLEKREAEAELARQELARRAEDLARSNAELEQFAYVASHDLQEPLRMVASYTQLLAKRYNGQLDATAHEFIDYAVDGASRMQVLINDLLTLSRVGTRGGELAPCDAEGALATALRNLELTLEESGAQVTHDALPAVLADGAQLTQIFQNLIGNAVKFHTEQEPRVHISARREGDDVEISVRDNGIGIERQYADRIFVMFQRLHGRGDYPGTGIGLAICKKIVERHSGRIWVESEPGGGSTFSFTLRAVSIPARVAA